MQRRFPERSVVLAFAVLFYCSTAYARHDLSKVFTHISIASYSIDYYLVNIIV